MKVNFGDKTVGGFNYEFTRGVSLQTAGGAEFGECIEYETMILTVGRRNGVKLLIL